MGVKQSRGITGPEPCITGPAKCKRTEQESQAPFNPDAVKVVAWGMDALYTNYDGDLVRWLEPALEELKLEAQADNTPVEFPDLSLFGEPVMVHPRGGVRGYRYHVSNSKCDVFLVGAGENQPALWMQPRAEYLREVGPRRLVEEQRASVEGLFLEAPLERANRMDLHVDLTGVTWEAFSVRFTGERFEVVNATYRAKDVQTHSKRGRMTAFTVGKRSGSTYLRIYDKTLELEEKGHLGALAEGEVTHYLPEIWKQHGWAGITGATREGKPQFQRVLRIEFELGREVLKQFRSWQRSDDPFIDSWDTALPLVDSIWRYCLLKWFVMREPGEATQKTRWRLAGWWERLATLPMLDGPQAVGARVCQRQASKRKLAQLAAGIATSLGALEGLSKGEALHALVAAAQSEMALKDYGVRVRLKGRSWRARLPLAWIAEQERRVVRHKPGVA